MPLYEYACLDCSERFEELRPATQADASIPCTVCKGPRVKRLLSVFSTRTAGLGSTAVLSSGGGCACGGSCSCRN